MICAFYAAEVKMRKLVRGSWRLRSVRDLATMERGSDVEQVIQMIW